MQIGMKLKDLIECELNRDNLTTEYKYWLECYKELIFFGGYSTDKQTHDTVKETIENKETLVNGIAKYT